jgi:hypothetical protein
MKEAADFFAKFMDGIVSGLNTCLLAEIVSYDAEAMTADVETLPDRDLIPSVPIAAQRAGGFVVRVPYAKGDIVMVVFAQRDIEAIMHGEGDATERKLALDDALIVGGVSPFTKPLPAANSSDLVIGLEDMTAKLVLTSAGMVQIVAPGGITLQGSTRTESW